MVGECGLVVCAAVGEQELFVLIAGEHSVEVRVDGVEHLVYLGLLQIGLQF